MAINPLSVPNFGGPYSGGADFAPLGNLGNVMQAQQDRQRQLAALGQLGTDPTQNAMTLIKSNDPRLAQTGLELMQNITRQKYLESQQEESKREFAQTQGLAREKFEAEDPDSRLESWVKAHPGKDPQSPEAQAYAYRMPQLLKKDPELEKKGLTPYFGVGTGEKGEETVVPLQLGQQGFTQAPMPPGVSFRNKPIVVSGPTGDALIDPISRQQVGFVPKDVAGAERQKELGAAEGKAIVSLPQIEATTTSTLETLDKLLKHPGLDISVGRSGLAYSKLDPVLQPNAYRNFMALYNQLQSQAFLQVYDQMRGAGAISNYEDQKGTAAKLGMQQAQTKEDFIAAAEDYRKVIERGLEKARKMTKISSPQAETPTAPISSGGTGGSTAAPTVDPGLEAEMRKRGFLGGPVAAPPASPAPPISR